MIREYVINTLRQIGAIPSAPPPPGADQGAPSSPPPTRSDGAPADTWTSVECWRESQRRLRVDEIERKGQT